MKCKEKWEQDIPTFLNLEFKTKLASQLLVWKVYLT